MILSTQPRQHETVLPPTGSALRKDTLFECSLCQVLCARIRHHFQGSEQHPRVQWRSSLAFAFAFPFAKTMMMSSSSYPTNSSNSNGIAYKMTVVLVTMLAILWGVARLQTPLNSSSSSKSESTFLPCPKKQPSKRSYELFTLIYTPIWVFCFGIIVVAGLYEDFTAWSYDYVCVGLALPFLLQPVLAPSIFHSPDGKRPLCKRYSFKANLWIAVFSFIGNYWYTHYFYSVLKAKYTMPAHRLNDVPIAFFFATHFYFSTYHLLSNVILRKIVTTYKDGFSRKLLFWGTVVCFSYFTAFMETLTISAFPYYSFQDRDMVSSDNLELTWYIKRDWIH